MYTHPISKWTDACRRKQASRQHALYDARRQRAVAAHRQSSLLFCKWQLHQVLVCSSMTILTFFLRKTTGKWRRSPRSAWGEAGFWRLQEVPLDTLHLLALSSSCTPPQQSTKNIRPLHFVLCFTQVSWYNFFKIKGLACRGKRWRVSAEGTPWKMFTKLRACQTRRGSRRLLMSISSWRADKWHRGHLVCSFYFRDNQKKDC